MELKKRENIGWIDLLRVIACFFVVFSHCCDAFIGQFDANRESFLTGTFLGSLMRPCVPIFVMMTGVLLFPVRTDMGTFYKNEDRETDSSDNLLVTGLTCTVFRISELHQP